MKELGELQKRREEFKKRNVTVIAVSNDDQKTAQETQKDYPDVVVLADHEQKLARAMDVLHPGVKGHDGVETNAPTTFVVDPTGTVRWLFRPDRFIVRLSPDELLQAIDRQ